MNESLTNRLLAELDPRAGITIQTLCQLVEKPMASVSHELSTMDNSGMVYEKSGQIFLTAHGTRVKSELSGASSR